LDHETRESTESRETLRATVLSRFAVFARLRGLRNPNALPPLHDPNFLHQPGQLAHRDKRIKRFACFYLSGQTQGTHAALEYAKTFNGTDFIGAASPCTIRRILSVVARLNVSSPQRAQRVAGIFSTKMCCPSISKTSLTVALRYSVEPQI
jgi:hypothetical protein